MNTKIIYGSEELGERIRKRRNELGLTIEESAAKAKIGAKSWSRYEAGGSIRADKAASICKVLNWRTLPEQDIGQTFDLSEYKKRKTWSAVLAEQMGEGAAISFVVGSDMLMSHLTEDLEELAACPKGTHIGELGCSWIKDDLPEQFLMSYDYDFLYYMKKLVVKYQKMAEAGSTFVAHTVAEELTLYLIMEESRIIMEGIEDEDGIEDWEAWPFEIFDDDDLVIFLYSDFYLEPDNSYHFSNWRKEQFYC